MKMKMKQMKQILMCAPVLLFAACNKSPQGVSAIPDEFVEIENGSLLRTDLPPESLGGTPVPIIFGGIPARLVPPEHVRGPGSLGVRYGLVSDHR